MIPNVLAERYASSEMSQLFDPVTRVRVERELWVAVLESQIELGLDVDRAAVADYRKVIDDIDLDSIAIRER